MPIDDYKKIFEMIDSTNRVNSNLKIDSPQKFNLLLCNINKFMTKRLEDFGGETCLKWFLKTMKRYHVLLQIMSLYGKNSFAYKEQIIKNLNEYSNKTILHIVNEALTKKYIIYISNNIVTDSKKKLIVPSPLLLSSYIHWNIKHISNYSNAIKQLLK